MKAIEIAPNTSLEKRFERCIGYFSTEIQVKSMIKVHKEETLSTLNKISSFLDRRNPDYIRINHLLMELKTQTNSL